MSCSICHLSNWLFLYFFYVRSEAKYLKMLVLIFMLLGLSIFSVIYFVRHNVEDIAQFSLETDDCYVYG